jgi:hypothetical protein
LDIERRLRRRGGNAGGGFLDGGPRAFLGGGVTGNDAAHGDTDWYAEVGIRQPVNLPFGGSGNLEIKYGDTGNGDGEFSGGFSVDLLSFFN